MAQQALADFKFDVPRSVDGCPNIDLRRVVASETAMAGSPADVAQRFRAAPVCCAAAPQGGDATP